LPPPSPKFIFWTTRSLTFILLPLYFKSFVHVFPFFTEERGGDIYRGRTPPIAPKSVQELLSALLFNMPTTLQSFSISI
jgi:hypothetical protein